MRSNLPVTNVEYVLQDAETIVSKTDLQGNITYVNRDFINISGFSEQELIGSPQNIVRHPDMPREAFEDFWRTLKSGKAWTGLVKNRCKNGDHYWVEANAAPLMENGHVIGYTSIRIKPTREQVQAAESAYKAIKAGGSALEIRGGEAVKRSSFRKLNIAATTSIQTRSLQSLVMAASMCGLAFAMLFGYMLHVGIVIPLKHARQDVDRMSAGDLSGKIASHGNDELSEVLQALRILQTNVKLLVGQIKEMSDL
eukprot:gene24725-26616_t